MFGLSVGPAPAARLPRTATSRAGPSRRACTASLTSPSSTSRRVFAASGAFHRSASMCTQRASSSAVCGYSSLSIMFLSMRQVHQPVDLGLQPRLAERRQVLARVAVEQQLVRHDLVGVPRILLPVGDPVLGHRHRQVVRCEHVILQRVADGVPGVQHRGSPWRLAGSLTWSGDGNGNPGRPGTPEPGSPGSPGRPAGTAELTSLGSSGPRIASTKGTVVWMRNWPMVELSSCWLTVLRKPSPGSVARAPVFPK